MVVIYEFSMSRIKLLITCHCDDDIDFLTNTTDGNNLDNNSIADSLLAVDVADFGMAVLETERLNLLMYGLQKTSYFYTTQ